LLRGGSQAPEKARYPETEAVFVSQRHRSRGSDRRDSKTRGENARVNRPPNCQVAQRSVNSSHDCPPCFATPVPPAVSVDDNDASNYGDCAEIGASCGICCRCALPITAALSTSRGQKRDKFFWQRAQGMLDLDQIHEARLMIVLEIGARVSGGTTPPGSIVCRTPCAPSGEAIHD